jgi:hypothetical protein
MNPSFQDRMQYAREVLAQPRYAFIAVLAALVYVGFTMITVLYVHDTLQNFYRSMYFTYTFSFSAFTVLLSVVFGINIALFTAKVREVRLKSASLGATGIFFGSLAAGCPGCFFGLFPLVLSVFGISATLAILPFNGIELQALALMALCLSSVTLAKETRIVCKLPKR